MDLLAVGFLENRDLVSTVSLRISYWVLQSFGMIEELKNRSDIYLIWIIRSVILLSYESYWVVRYFWESIHLSKRCGLTNLEIIRLILFWVPQILKSFGLIIMTCIWIYTTLQRWQT